MHTQQKLEEIFSRHQLIPLLRKEFKVMTEDVEHIPTADCYTDIMVQIYLHKQANPETMVGVLTPQHGSPQKVADMLLEAVNLDLLDYHEINEVFMVKYNVSDDVEEKLKRFQYPLPMITKPNKVKNNYDTGYNTIKGFIVLNDDQEETSRDLCLDHINRANSVALEIDMYPVESTQGKFVKPTRKTGEGFSDYNFKVKQARMFYDVSVEIMEGLSEMTDKIYMTHKYDRRGRCYASGYHINTQGDDYRKAVLQFSRKEKIIC